MEKLKFSVLISVYCKEKASNLKVALDSIINQTLKPDEIILVEDGALNDELNMIIEEFENKYSFLKVIKLEKNVGLGNALNEGLKHCTCDYVARMDSDDISLNERFEKQLEYIKKHNEIDVIGGNIMEFDDITGEDISLRKVPCKMEDIFQYLKKRNPMNHVTVIFKKQSVVDAGGYLNCPYFEDYYLWARMIKNNCNFHNIDETLVRVRAGLSMSNRRGNMKYIKCIYNFEMKLLKLKLINIAEFLYNICVRCIIALIPNKLRYTLYQKRLRNEKN